MLSLAMAVGAVAELTAVGVITSAHPGGGAAILRSGARVRVVAIGEQAFGARLTQVAPDRVVLDVGGQSVELRLTGAPSPPPEPAIPASPEPAMQATPVEPAAVEQALSREHVQRRLASEIPRILGETALQPATEDGRIVGLRLVRVASGTLLTELGLQAGDVLTEVNGTPTDSLPALVGLWTRLQNETALRATVLRGGRPLQLSVTLR
ncbi:MAG TPA: type II secretion system protein N [Vicinamibacteria bacterium]|nr:type II secretion system protein N [Vicinamibacteria bacterium]